MKGIGAAAASAAVIILSGVGGAFSADLSAMPTKAPLAPAGPTTCTGIADFFTTACQLSWYGVRFYGTLDVGGNYSTNAAPYNGLAGTGVNQFLAKNSSGARFLGSVNGLTISNVGLQIKEPVGYGWSFVGQLETQFNPYSMELLNGSGSVFNTIHVPLSQQTAYGDSNSQGQFYNGLGFAGFSHDTYGTLTFGRQNTLMGDAILAYDPMGSSNAFSVLGFFGGFAGGGDTEDRKGTTALKYRVNYANWHFGAFAQLGDYSNGNASKGAYQGDIGADFKLGPGVLSTDVVGGYTRDAVALAIVGQVNSFGYPVNINTASAESLSATISNNTNVMATAKYSWDRWKLYAGYEWIQFADPSDNITSFTDIAGDQIGAVFNNGTAVSTTAFLHGDKILQLAWIGGTYSILPTLDATAAYYHEWQNDYSGGLPNKPAIGSPMTCSQSSTALSSCAGQLDAVSAMLDWRFAPKWDTYLGTLYSKQTGGLDNSFMAKDNWSTTAGIRFRW
jgi:predicted porin